MPNNNKTKTNPNLYKLKKTELNKHKVKTGIVITTHGFNGVYARQCLESFIRELPTNYYIVLYINESKDPITLNLINTHINNNVQIIYVENQTDHGGLTGTWNKGIDICIQQKCDVIVIANDDIVFDGSINNILLTCYQEKNSMKYFGPLSNNPGPKGCKVNMCQYGIHPVSAPPRIALYKKQPCNLNGFFMVFSTEVLLKNMFDKTHYFDPSKPFATNEVEWFKRFKAKGGLPVVVPQTFIYHYKLSSWRNGKQNNLCIYTINTGLYDGTNIYLNKRPTDTLYFTDNFTIIYKCIKKGLKPFYVDTRHKDTKLRQRLIKTNPSEYLPHHYTMSIYVDANISIKRPNNNNYRKLMHIVDKLKKNKKTMLYCFRHPIRNSVLKEAERIKQINLETPENCYKIINEFKTYNFSDNIGLTETNCLIRKHKPLTAFHKDWNRCINLCLRDQLSFDYLLFKHNIKYHKFSNAFKKTIFKRHYHVNSKNRTVIK
jgi:GT2 family glycosyltransferase